MNKKQVTTWCPIIFLTVGVLHSVFSLLRIGGVLEISPLTVCLLPWLVACPFIGVVISDALFSYIDRRRTKRKSAYDLTFKFTPDPPTWTPGEPTAEDKVLEKFQYLIGKYAIYPSWPYGIIISPSDLHWDGKDDVAIYVTPKLRYARSDWRIEGDQETGVVFEQLAHRYFTIKELLKLKTIAWAYYLIGKRAIHKEQNIAGVIDYVGRDRDGTVLIGLAGLAPTHALKTWCIEGEIQLAGAAFEALKEKYFPSEVGNTNNIT